MQTSPTSRDQNADTSIACLEALAAGSEESALLAACAGPSARPAVLSIGLAPPTTDEKVAGFQVLMHGIAALALCHKPPAWIVSFGSGNGSGGGFLGGQAKSAADDLGPTELKELLRMYLVVPNGKPAELEGIVKLRSPMGGETRDMPMTTSTVYLEQADRCD